MPTNYEVEDSFNFLNQNVDYFDQPYSFSKDEGDFDCIYDESFQQQFTSDFNVSLPFESSNDVLLQDSSPDKIIFEATTNTFNESYWNSINKTCNINIPKSNMITNIDTDDLKMEILSSLGSSSDEEIISSHSPTPSSNSSTTDDYLINMASANNSYQHKNYLQPQSKDPVLINGNICQMYILNAPQKNNKKIPLIKPKIVNKVPITKNVKLKNNINKTSLIFPKVNSIVELSSSPPLLNCDSIPDGDIKAFKRQQRMIKNRESASISRKRKKDYVVSLEKQLEDLSNENKHLKQENSLLKQQLCAIQSQSNTNPTRKQTAILLAIILTVSINITGIKNIFATPEMASFPTNEIISHDFHSRHLMSVQNDNLNDSTSFNVTTKCTHQNQTDNVKLKKYLHKYMKSVTDRQLRKMYDVKRSSGLFVDLFNRRMPLKLQRKSYRQNYDDMQLYNSYQLMNQYLDYADSMDLKEDTFYVLSLKPDNNMFILATSQNQSTRPKMALLMPTVNNESNGHNNDSSKTDQITLMKIDCEVTNTNIVHIKEKIIPKPIKARHNPLFSNSTNPDTQSTGIQNSQTYNMSNISEMVLKGGNTFAKNISITKKRYKFNYKPYFIKTIPDLSNSYDLKMKNFGFL